MRFELVISIFGMVGVIKQLLYSNFLAAGMVLLLVCLIIGLSLNHKISVDI